MSTPITTLKGVGAAREQQLNRLGLTCVEELPFFYPRSYQDRSVVKPLMEVQDGESCSVCATVMTAPGLVRIRKGMELVKFRISDGSATAEVTFFNQTWIKNSIRRGEEYLFYGSWEAFEGPRRIASPSVERPGSPAAGAIVPVYRLTAGLSQKVLGGLVWQGVERMLPQLADPLPQDLLQRYRLMPLQQALREAHRPEDGAQLESARRRLIFEEFLTLQLGLSLLGRRARRETPVHIAPCDMAPFFQALPFVPTGAQRRAMEQGLADLGRPVAMNRLVQGDVGSGKTVVAAALCYAAAQSGYQSALMAPTEILAEQHHRTLSALLGPLGLRVALVTGGRKAAERREALQLLESGEAMVAVGTHALLESGVALSSLGLVITDEQHRFGVAQRGRLAAKGEAPHLLVMSATPIPRTLALIIYGDLDLSVIDELPAGRRKIETYAVDGGMRPRIHQFMRKLLDQGRQVFVVCPLVEDEGDSRKSAQQVAEILSEELAPHSVAMLHGRMKSAEKEEVMRRFLDGEIGALVSTTVVEVGVDVPNAALMMIEDADRFGLSQLHQLRGRVGRGPHQSYCILMSDARGEAARERISTMVETDDGFVIAERDLQLRGPGDFFGQRQHGLPALHIADLSSDMQVLSEAGEAAKELLERDPGLQQPQHRALLQKTVELFERSDIALN